MENIILSIIVPIFNVEKYLNRCIDSILIQEIEKFELILVNDGSKDNSGMICDDYVKKDSRIRVFHTDNKGLSAARNLGLDVAIGKYITFVDSDDFLDPDTYKQNLLILQDDSSIDMLQFPYNYPYGQPSCKVCGKFDENLYGLHQIYDTWFHSKDKMAAAVWNKIFRKEIFDQIRFPIGKMYEDTYITPQLLNQINHVRLSDIGCYNYVYNPSSLLRSKFSFKKQADYFEAYFELMEFEKTHGFSKSGDRRLIELRLVYMSLFREANEIEYNRRQELFEKLNKYQIENFSILLAFDVKKILVSLLIILFGLNKTAAFLKK